jgi:hypothetical protein
MPRKDRQGRHLVAEPNLLGLPDLNAIFAAPLVQRVDFHAGNRARCIITQGVDIPEIVLLIEDRANVAEADASELSGAAY